MDTRSYCPWRKAFPLPRFAHIAAIALLVTLLPACSPAAIITPSPSPTVPPPPTATAFPTATTAPTQTPLPSPTITLTFTPQPTPTQTATAMPAILQDGFDAWCVPGDSHNLGVVTSTKPDDAGRYKQVKDAIQMTVPTGACTFVYKFNQAVPAAAEFQIYDILDHLAYKMPLVSPDGEPNMGLATITEKLMLDPPYYEIHFRLAVFTPDAGQLWTSKVIFARPIPQACFDPNSGIWPNPVTGQCPASDPRELELCRKPGSLSCYHRGITEKEK